MDFQEGIVWFVIIAIGISLVGKFIGWISYNVNKAIYERKRRREERKKEEARENKRLLDIKRYQDDAKRKEDARYRETVKNAGILRKHRIIQSLLRDVFSADIPPKAIFITNRGITVGDQYTSRFSCDMSAVSSKDINRLNSREILFANFGMPNMKMNQIDAFAYIVIQGHKNVYKVHREEGYESPDYVTLYQEPPRYTQEEENRKTSQAWFIN